ncbi:DMT family transporter [Pectobacterium aroidearum]|uniref:DMT family transporter n=1 Tax=Pectobacterium aroidearum TaxID=1201031 RepID=UPI0015F0010D|nr:DMT family transporter [Pectobacterium aroidearum]MBA5234955.1 DMT family transporter [Pectobacterium aroidearum]
MHMLIFIALFNGMVISSARVINGQLSTHIGAFRTSLWNHAVGFLFLTLLVSLFYWQQLTQFNWLHIPAYAWLGGGCGALFVATSSYVFPKMGALNTSVLIIGGQMFSAVLFDLIRQGSDSHIVQLLGVGLITVGIILSTLEKYRDDK